jgi:hypothetical protein
VVVYSYTLLGHIRERQREYAEAAALYRQSLIYAAGARNSRAIGLGLEGLAQVAAAQGQSVRAARLLGAESQLRETSGVQLLPVYRQEYNRYITLVQAELGETAFAAAWEAGCALSVPEAIDEALAGAAPSLLSHPL